MEPTLRASSSFSHALVTDIVAEFVPTGSGFVYPTSCCPASSLVSSYERVAFVFVRSEYDPSPLSTIYFLSSGSRLVYVKSPFLSLAIVSYVYWLGYTSKVTVYLTPFSSTPSSERSQLTAPFSNVASGASAHS